MISTSHRVVLDESSPANALGALEIDARLRDELLASEASAKKRIELWQTRVRCDDGLASLGYPRRWPEARNELKKAHEDLSTAHDIMLGLALASVLLHDEALDRERNDVSDRDGAMRANVAIGEHRRLYGDVLKTLGAGGFAE